MKTHSRIWVAPKIFWGWAWRKEEWFWIFGGSLAHFYFLKIIEQIKKKNLIIKYICILSTSLLENATKSLRFNSRKMHLTFVQFKEQSISCMQSTCWLVTRFCFDCCLFHARWPSTLYWSQGINTGCEIASSLFCQFFSVCVRLLLDYCIYNLCNFTVPYYAISVSVLLLLYVIL